jgi:hypothetical protein
MEKRTEISRKITMKGIVGNVKTIAKTMKDGETMPLVKLLGFVDSAEAVETEYGTSTRFKGDFIAESMIDDKQPLVSSTKCFVPPILEDLINKGLEELDGTSLKLAFVIAVKADESIPVGYEYKTWPLIKPKPSNPMLELMEAIKETQAVEMSANDEKKKGKKS